MWLRVVTLAGGIDVDLLWVWLVVQWDHEKNGQSTSRICEARYGACAEFRVFVQQDWVVSDGGLFEGS